MNLDSYKRLMIGQYEAPLRTLHAVLEAVTPEIWAGKLANHGFDQSVFHALFYTDVYLSKNEHVVSDQEFHKHHATIFEGYEEFNFDPPTRRYRLEFATQYHAFCLEKARQVVNAETDESLAAEAGFSWQQISRGELHVYNIRHLQHHVAQFIMRLRLDADVHIDWYKSGWNPG